MRVEGPRNAPSRGPEPTPEGLEECIAVGLVCEHGVHAAAWCDICDTSPDGTVAV